VLWRSRPGQKLVMFSCPTKLVATREHLKYATFAYRDAAPSVTTSTSEADPLPIIANRMPRRFPRKSLNPRNRSIGVHVTLCVTVSHPWCQSVLLPNSARETKRGVTINPYSPGDLLRFNIVASQLHASCQQAREQRERQVFRNPRSWN